MFARRIRSARRGSSGVGSIRRENYNTVNGMQTKAGWWEIRAKIIARDGGLCRALIGGKQCKKPANEVHHLVPLSSGGTNSPANLISLCQGCHDKRHNHLHRARRG
ncbi:HNH endonuclease [Burkholderia phage BcepSaruman]|uniref:HNH endonuclease n=1 Tax=Burkholderia phage BcepSaruman TaxID=2530032 RepID=A0A4D5ZC28_9CAUD|nr:HNH endonuclease [Burkholderia phage BcepSaruman]QBX06504.1 HNH endonuclease [Burkholderia phage BcepSaruman]